MEIRSISITSDEHLRRVLAGIGVHNSGIQIMTSKSRIRHILVRDLKAPAAAALKQSLLSAGGDCAVNAGVITCTTERSDALIMATTSQLQQAMPSIAAQPWKLSKVAEIIEAIISEDTKGEDAVNFAGFPLDRPLVMGILNVTPDSFSDGGNFATVSDAIDRANQMMEQGADIIDIGGESSRPGSSFVSEEEELARVEPILKEIAATLPVSIDTRRSSVARCAAKYGARIINDITAATSDPAITDVVAEYDMAMILMHIQGTPDDMQDNPEYDDVVAHIKRYLAERIQVVRNAGVKPIAIDPGIGFGKTVEHNLSLLNSIPAFCDLGVPVVIGHSRKSFIGSVLGEEIEERLIGSVAVALKAAALGATILRVHDVKETVQALMMWNEIENARII